MDKRLDLPLAMLAGVLFWLVYFAFYYWQGASFAAPEFELKQVVMICVLIPIAEEAAFRGWLQTHLLSRFPSKTYPSKSYPSKIYPSKTYLGLSLANVLTSLAFMALHLVYNPSLMAAAVFIPSLLFGLLRERHNSIVPSTLLHIAYNSGYYVLMLVLGYLV